MKIRVFTHNHMTIFFCAILAMGLATPTAFAASTKEEIRELRAEIQSMQADLNEIKRLLQQGGRPAAPAAPSFEPVDITLDNAAVMGDQDAVITLVEYSDYQCPYCRRHYSTVMPEIVKQYVNTGKVRYVMREFPLTSMHPQAKDASLAALCARDQDKYWEMHNLLFDNQRAMSMEDFKGHAVTLELDAQAFDDCLATQKHESEISSHLSEGGKMGVRGTPSFVIGLTDSSDPNKARVSKFIRGAQGYNSFSSAIDELLAEADAGNADNDGP